VISCYFYDVNDGMGTVQNSTLSYFIGNRDAVAGVDWKRLVSQELALIICNRHIIYYDVLEDCLSVSI